MDIKSEVIEIIDELLIVEIENRFDIRVPVTEFGRDDWNTANKIIAGIVELQNA